MGTFSCSYLKSRTSMQPFDSFLKKTEHFNGYVRFSAGGDNVTVMLMRVSFDSKLYVSRSVVSCWLRSFQSAPSNPETAMMISHNGMAMLWVINSGFEDGSFPQPHVKAAKTIPAMTAAPTGSFQIPFTVMG